MFRDLKGKIEDDGRDVSLEFDDKSISVTVGSPVVSNSHRIPSFQEQTGPFL
jgi:hypothetical protein